MLNEENVIGDWIQYKRQCFGNDRPKTVLYSYCGKNRIPPPKYESRRVDRQFYSICTFQEKKYSSTVWHRSKKLAEQAAALVCSFHVGLYEEDFLISTGCLFTRTQLCSLCSWKILGNNLIYVMSTYQIHVQKASRTF